MLVREEVLLTDLYERKILFQLKIYYRLRQATCKRSAFHRIGPVKAHFRICWKSAFGSTRMGGKAYPAQLGSGSFHRMNSMRFLVRPVLFSFFRQLMSFSIS